MARETPSPMKMLSHISLLRAKAEYSLKNKLCRCISSPIAHPALVMFILYDCLSLVYSYKIMYEKYVKVYFPERLFPDSTQNKPVLLNAHITLIL